MLKTWYTTIHVYTNQALSRPMHVRPLEGVFFPCALTHRRLVKAASLGLPCGAFFETIGQRTAEGLIICQPFWRYRPIFNSIFDSG